MATLALPTRARSRSESRSSAPADTQVAAPIPPRPPRSLSRPSPPKINIDIQTILQQSTPRNKGFSGSLALQARDSLSVRKRTMSMGAVSARVARQNARKTNVDSLSVSGPLSSARCPLNAFALARLEKTCQVALGLGPKSKSSFPAFDPPFALSVALLFFGFSIAYT